MANISISEIQTTNEYLKNDDLLLCSVKDHSNNTYQSARINGLQLKTSVSMPPIRNLKTFTYNTIKTSDIITETVTVANDSDTRYIAYYKVTLPVSSYVFVQGNFIMTKAYMSTAKYCDQFLAVRYKRDDNRIAFANLCPATCGFIDSDNSNIWVSVQLSYWRGYAEAGTEFVLMSKYYLQETDRDAFVNGIATSAGGGAANRLELAYWTPVQLS